MSTATWVQEELERWCIPYEEMHHPDAYTAQEMAQQEHVSGHRVAKVVCVMVNGWPMELVLPASRRVILEQVGLVLETDSVRLATEKETERYFTDCETGAIPALRHWKGVEVIMDGHLRVDGDIYILGGTHRDALRVPFDEWFAMVNPRVELLSEPDQGR
jgi:Ala-tRNA(Pro) deacylase